MHSGTNSQGLLILHTFDHKSEFFFLRKTGMFATNVKKTHPKSLTAFGQTSDTGGLSVMLLEMSGDNQGLQDSLSWKPERACKNSLQSVEPWRSFVWAKVVN